jgi:DNA polymerase/3'-5' exonuclease PolX
LKEQKIAKHNRRMMKESERQKRRETLKMHEELEEYWRRGEDARRSLFARKGPVRKEA